MKHVQRASSNPSVSCASVMYVFPMHFKRNVVFYLMTAAIAAAAATTATAAAVKKRQKLKLHKFR